LQPRASFGKATDYSPLGGPASFLFQEALRV
jgi:hypothetical protein